MTVDTALASLAATEVMRAAHARNEPDSSTSSEVRAAPYSLRMRKPK